MPKAFINTKKKTIADETSDDTVIDGLGIFDGGQAVLDWATVEGFAQSITASPTAASGAAATTTGTSVSGSSMSASGMSSSLTGIQNVDALLTRGRWNATALTYNFPLTASYYNANYGALLDADAQNLRPNFITATVGLQNAINTVLSAGTQPGSIFSAVSNLTFTLVGTSSTADISAAMVPLSTLNTARVVDFVGTARDQEDGDVWFNTTDYSNPTLGTYAYFNVMHELGHAMGLKHGHDILVQSDLIPNYTVLSSDRDSIEFSVMTYRSYIDDPLLGGYTVLENNYIQTLMMYDIAAIQSMYGANYSIASGNSVYTFSNTTGEMFINGVSQRRPSANIIFRTVWDGGGEDTYDFSNYSTALSVDLAPGGWTDVDRTGHLQEASLGGGPNGGYARGQVFNALLFGTDLRSLIENANGGFGNDLIFGNQANNILRGNSGDDMLRGRGGDDRLEGGMGSDTLYGDNETASLSMGSGIALESNTVSVPTAIALNTQAVRMDAGFSLSYDANIISSTTLPHLTIARTNASGMQYYVLTVTSGMHLYADIDTTSAGFDSYITLFDSSGTAITTADDSTSTTGGGGSTSELDSFLDHTFLSSGTYYLRVANYPGTASIPAGGSYTLNVSVATTGDSGTLDSPIGNDTLLGGSGSDRLYGGGGNDTLTGGSGSDTLDGGDGFDIANYNDAQLGVIADLQFATENTGDALFDTFVSIEGLAGSDYADSLRGNGSGNTIYGNSGNDTIYGHDGNDTLIGGFGSDVLDGGNGLDIASYSDASSSIIVDLQFASSQNTGIAIGDLYSKIEGLSGSAYGDSLRGDASDNTIYGNGGNDTIYGRDGNDTLLGGGGNDVLDGENGLDIASYSDASSSIIVDLQFASSQNTGIAIGDIYLEIEGLSGSAYDDSLRGDAGDNTIYGNAGIDFLYGRDGNDTLSGGCDSDMMDGGNGFDIASYADSSTGLVIDIQFGASQNTGDAAGDVYFNIEAFSGSEFVDSIRGDALGNTLWANGGDDVVFGRGGNDYINGGEGQDLLIGGTGGDTLDGGSGFDTASYADSATGIIADLQFTSSQNAGDAAGDSYSSIEGLAGSFYSDSLRGNAGDNTIYGYSGIDVLYGRDGNDTLSGGDDNDFLFGENGNDILMGGQGADTLDGGAGVDLASYLEAAIGVIADLQFASSQNTNEASGDFYALIEGLAGSNLGDSLRGDAGNNTLYGNGGNDDLYGRDGNDTLAGSAGADFLSGGNGLDTFMFSAGDGADTIVDFYAGAGATDVIQLATALGVSSFTDVISRSAQVGADTVITFATGDSLRLSNMQRTSLVADDFSFA